jgi:cytidylate kinase
MTQINAIAIDGPAGSGKSTIARAVGEKLGFLYIDTGAMYRAVTLKAKRLGIDLEDEEKMGKVARSCALEFDATGTRIFLDGEEVSEEIRTPRITSITRYAARALPVRAELVRRQQEMAAARPAIMEGRDITTVVLKDAKWRFFLTASAEERAARRFKEMRGMGHEVEYSKLLAEIRERDESDNAVGPMQAAQEIARNGGGITLVDTTGLSIQDVIDKIISCVNVG